MNPRERDHGQRNPKTERMLFEQRIEVDKRLRPTPEQIVEGLDEFQRETVPTMLQLIQQSFDMQKHNQKPKNASAIHTTVSLILLASDTLQLTGVKELAEGSPNMFAYCFDLQFGMRYLGAMMTAAQQKIAGTLEEESQQSLDEVTEMVNLSPEKQAEASLLLNKYATSISGLLRQDPTGFSAVNALARSFDNPTSAPSYTVSQWASAGAEAAAKIYKLIYPQAAALLKPK